MAAEERVRGADVLGCEGEWELSDHVPLFLEVGVGLVQGGGRLGKAEIEERRDGRKEKGVDWR